MAPLSRSTTTGQLKGTLFSTREPTTAREREVQLFGRSDPPPSPVLGALSGGYIAEAIDALPLSLLLVPAPPSWPPPGARDNSPRGTSRKRVLWVVSRPSADTKSSLLQSVSSPYRLPSRPLRPLPPATRSISTVHLRTCISKFSPKRSSAAYALYP